MLFLWLDTLVMYKFLNRWLINSMFNLKFSSVFSLIQSSYPMTPTQLMIHYQMNAASDSANELGSELELYWSCHAGKGRFCVAHWPVIAIHQFPTMTYRRGVSPQIRVVLYVGQEVSMFDVLLKIVTIR